jgi:hypothetical protein
MLGIEMGVQLEYLEGWLTRFMERHLLTLRTITANWTVPRDIIARRAASFYLYCRQILLDTRVPVSNIVAFDETALFVGHPGNTTVHGYGTYLNQFIKHCSLSIDRDLWELC